jgi:hypothetical protein
MVFQKCEILVYVLMWELAALYLEFEISIQMSEAAQLKSLVAI